MLRLNMQCELALYKETWIIQMCIPYLRVCPCIWYINKLHINLKNWIYFCVIMLPLFLTDHVCFRFCRVVQVLWLHWSLRQQRQKPEQEDSEDTREQPGYCNVTRDVFFRAHCWDLLYSWQLNFLHDGSVIQFVLYSVTLRLNLFHLLISFGK